MRPSEGYGLRLLGVERTNRWLGICTPVFAIVAAIMFLPVTVTLNDVGDKASIAGRFIA